MADLQASLSGIVPFIAYFITAIVMLLIFMKIYTVMTPHDEMALIKENNVAASVVFSAAFLGFSLPLASAAANSVSIIDFIIWGIIACAAQLVVYQVFRRFFPKVTDRIKGGEMAISTNLAAISLTVGLLNAACITY
ncbi:MULTISPECIES: DUF350 domain-containing protein [Stappiaceae]|jgi:putative membrane protein|uniref:DUF350 domain-containing protein n=2 Tax=Roseibium TaxID=150830 RepID=A0ABM6I021_9HYPH|nr:MULTISPECIES: DUF350 domain-containing protein [Stappiaceae]MCR9281940.1 DUF350 domain-containing protein [Paracoccaceae bacterium]MEC9404732.1 DUF350 domain-containing protein [Pseudomonadota bacterium]AMN55138.1 membrane protein [Labrenzia sp. CP4]AQQ03652.1 DUF350 domain-containing protein [Roseibium aggregatum]ERP97125.1 membrane protein [Labrenzia sp. C1B10]